MPFLPTRSRSSCVNSFRLFAYGFSSGDGVSSPGRSLFIGRNWLKPFCVKVTRESSLPPMKSAAGMPARAILAASLISFCAVGVVVRTWDQGVTHALVKMCALVRERDVCTICHALTDTCCNTQQTHTHICKRQHTNVTPARHLQLQ